MTKYASRLLLLAPAVLWMAACETASPPGTEFESLNLAIEHMRLAENLSDEQISVLLLAQEEGRNVTQEEYWQGYQSFAECVTDAGINVVEIAQFGELGGGVSYSLTVGSRIEDEEQTFVVYGACHTHTVQFIEMAWLMRGEAIEAQDFVLAQFQPAMRECVEALGVEVHEGMGHVDIIELERLHRGEHAPYEETCVVTTGLDEALDGA